MRIRSVAAALLMLTAMVAAPAPAAAAVDGRWAQPGPYAVSVQIRAAHTLYYPTRMDGRHPVVVWGNGTFAWPGIYGDLLRHLASHGIIVAAANTSWAGTGVEMRAGIDLMTSLNGDPSSPFYQHVDVGHVGATGHSQGGLGAINAGGADPRIDTTVPIQPGPGGNASRLRGPGLFLAGERDTTVRPAWVVADWDEADQVPAVYGALRGADHFVPTGNGGGFRGVITAWFRFHLMADERARGEFFGGLGVAPQKAQLGAGCGLCTDAAWTDVRRNAKALAVPGV